MSLLKNAEITPSRQVFRKMQILDYRHPDHMPRYAYEDMPCIEINIPAEDWYEIKSILHLYANDREHPALRDLANQFIEMRLLLGEK